MPRRLYGEDSENDDEGNNNEFPRTPTRDHQHGEGNGEGEQPGKVLSAGSRSHLESIERRRSRLVSRRDGLDGTLMGAGRAYPTGEQDRERRDHYYDEPQHVEDSTGEALQAQLRTDHGSDFRLPIRRASGSGGAAGALG